MTNPTMESLTEGESLPEVKENAIEAIAAAELENVAAANSEAPPSAGDGEPKKRGRKKGGKNAPKTEKLKKTAFYAGDATTSTATAAQEAQLSSRQAAVAISGVIEVATVKLISEEWALTEMERTLNQNAWEKTFDHYGGVNLTPPMELALSHLQIVTSRALGDKTTRGKLQLGWLWLKNKIRRKEKAPEKTEGEKEAQ